MKRARRSERVAALALVAAALLLGCRPAPPPPAALPPDVIVADFEQSEFVGLTASGAFGPGPDVVVRPGQGRVTGYRGQGFASSFTAGTDGGTGSLLSDEFTIVRPFLSFLAGGRYDPEHLTIQLLVDGQPVRSATGNAADSFNVDHLAPNFWDVRALQGRPARLRVTDGSDAPRGHLLIDEVVMSARPPARRDLQDEWLAEANLAVARRAGRMGQDPLRPSYHLQPSSQWMNDPNGLILHGGFFHVFFQHHPFSDAWGSMHWGHFRSRDLVSWERLPIALAPSYDEGEEHCFSGCAVRTPKNELMLIYTSIGARGPEQWGALATDEVATNFRKLDRPLLQRKDHGGLTVQDWRDPFVFVEEGVHYMVVGGHPEGGKGSIFLYRSNDLKTWTFLGVPFSGTEANWECPALFRLGDRWLLMYSPHGLVRYLTGALDLKQVKFTPTGGGVVDLGRSPAAKDGFFYAPNVLHDTRAGGGGRQIMFGWVRGFPAKRGWNGALSLPRVLSLDGAGALVQTPAPELDRLRGAPFEVGTVVLQERPLVVDGFEGDAFEIALSITLGDARRAGLKLRRSRDGGRAVVVGFDGEHLLVEEQLIKLGRPGRTLDLRIFVDRSMMEVFADGGRQVVTRIVRARPGELGVELFSAGGAATFTNPRLYRMGSIWP